MSWNRLRSDTCSYKNELAQSVGSLAWILDPSRFENDSKCRISHGASFQYHYRYIFALTSL